MSIKVTGYETQKLIIQNPSTSESFTRLIICGLLAAPISFLIASYLIYDFKLLKALDSSSLSCYRDKEEISCSLTGYNLYGNVEKVFSSNNKNSIKIVKSESAGSENHEDEYSILSIITEREEIFIFTPKKLVDIQVSNLNDFLINSNTTRLNIYTELSYQRNWVSSICFFLFFGGGTFFLCGANFLITFTLIIDICIATNYIFDKQNGKLICKRIFLENFLSAIPEIQLHEIKRIYVEEKTGQYPKVCLYSNSGVLLLSINAKYISETRLIANLICSFLKLEFYQIIQIPP